MQSACNGSHMCMCSVISAKLCNGCSVDLGVSVHNGTNVDFSEENTYCAAQVVDTHS